MKDYSVTATGEWRFSFTCHRCGTNRGNFNTDTGAHHWASYHLERCSGVESDTSPTR